MMWRKKRKSACHPKRKWAPGWKGNYVSLHPKKEIRCGKGKEKGTAPVWAVERGGRGDCPWLDEKKGMCGSGGKELF